MGAVGNAAGTTKSGLYNQLSVAEQAASAFTFAEYPFATYTSNFAVDLREEKLLQGENDRGLDLLGAKAQALKAGFARV